MHMLRMVHKGVLKSVLRNKGLGIKTKKCLYEGVIEPTALYISEAWGMRSAERMKVNVLEMKCFRSLVRVSSADQRVLRWYGHVERIDEYRMARRVLVSEVEYEADRGLAGWIL